MTELDRLGVARRAGSFADPASIAAALADTGVVVHLAAATRARSEREYAAANVTATRNLLRAAQVAERGPRRLVHMSTMAAAGPSSGGRPVAEDDPARPITAYGRTKLEAERAVLGAVAPPERAVIRAPAVYGPGDRDLLIYFRLARRGILPMPAGPDRWVQLVHVEDLARSIVRACSADAVAGIYQVAEPRAYRWAEVAEMIAEVVGRRVRRVRLPAWAVRGSAAAVEAASGWVGRASIFNRDKARELLAEGWLCETGRARDQLGWEPRYTLRDGLEQTVRWYREHGDL